MNAFFKSQFSYCPLSWMFHSRTLNNKINRLHERCLRIIYNDNTSSFTDLLEIDNSVSVHHRNIQVLATELYKFVNGLSPKLVSDCFKLNNMTVHNTRTRSTFYSRPVRTVLHGTESLSHLRPKIWELLPSDMKNLSSITTFKKVIKQWKPHVCPCRLCRTYISGWFRLTFEYKTNFFFMVFLFYLYICVYVCIYMYVCVCIYTYIHIHIYIYI